MPADIGDTALVERQLFLRTIAPVQLGGSIANALAELMDDVWFEPGASLFNMGDGNEHVFFLVSGTVELRDAEGKTWRFGERSMIGMIDAVLDRRATRAAMALDEVHALRLRADDWFDLLEDNFEYARRVMLSMAASLHRDRLKAGLAPPPQSRRAKHWVDVPEQPLSLVEIIFALRGVRGFSRASIQALTELARLSEEIRLAANEQLFDPGSFTDLCFVVARGAVELTREEPAVRAVFQAPALLGDALAIGPGDEQYAARALEDSVVLRIREEDLFDVMELHFDLLRSVMRDLAVDRETFLRERPHAEGAPPSNMGERPAE